MADQLIIPSYNALLSKERQIRAIQELYSRVSTGGGGAETDPIFSASPASNITSADIQLWNSITGKAEKSEMAITQGTGADADKATITLKDGLSKQVLTTHQDISGKADVSTVYTKEAVNGKIEESDYFQSNLAAIMSLAVDPNAGATIVTTNPEWKLVYTDSEDRILLGKRQDNTWYFATDLDTILDTIIDGYTTT